MRTSAAPPYYSAVLVIGIRAPALQKQPVDSPDNGRQHQNPSLLYFEKASCSKEAVFYHS